jgi:protein tyrosine/serine phosphatase
MRNWIALLLIVPHTLLAAQETSTRPPVRIKRFAKVNTSYYRGAAPNDQDFERLATLGIRTVIDLKQEGIVAEAAIVQRFGMRFQSIPMSSTSAPSEDVVAQFLKIVTDSDNQPVFVHCAGGRERTGVLTAVYRMTHDGWTAEQAFGEMTQYGYNSNVAGGALKDFVFDYARRLTPQRQQPYLAGLNTAPAKPEETARQRVLRGASDGRAETP